VFQLDDKDEIRIYHNLDRGAESEHDEIGLVAGALVETALM
jgi:hypothetical protein